MAEALNHSITFAGIDIGKNSFHVVGLDGRGAVVLRQKWSRGQVEARFANMPPCLIGMEACVGAHHLSRRLQRLGHDARLMPARYVRPYSKGQRTTSATRRPLPKRCSAQRLSSSRPRPLTNWTFRRCTACESGWSVSAPASSTRSAPFYWNVALPLGKDCASCAPSCRASSPNHPTFCRHAWFALLKIWPEIAPARRAHRASVEGDRSYRAPGRGLRAADQRARYRADHLQRDGSGDWCGRCILQGPRFRRLAGSRSQANLDRGPHDPRQDIKAR
jgi:hypothetical protein